jgi:serine/threonine protein kinase
MELDSYGIYSYFTGNVKSIQLSNIQTISISNTHVKTSQGEFQLEKKLGEGTYGKTYATVPINGISYAIKIMDVRNTAELYNILSEVIMNILIAEGTEDETNGPFVPRFYEFGLSADQRTAIIRYQRLTDTMFNYLNSKSPQENNKLVPQALLSIIHILETLQTKFQFDHRDLKSDNIMYTMKNAQPVWRIIDLGGSCMKWNGFSISSNAIFDDSRPCKHPGRDITFLLTEIILDIPLTVQLKTSLRKLVTFPIYGQLCALNSENCPQAKYKTWINIYNVLNRSNVINPKSAFVKSEMTQFLQKLKRPFWNRTGKKVKYGKRKTRRNGRAQRSGNTDIL